MRPHDSDYGRDHAFDCESFPQDLRITVELALPELGADDDSLGTILRFRGKKNSPQNEEPRDIDHVQLLSRQMPGFRQRVNPT